MRSKILFGGGVLLLLVAAILSALAWTPLPDLDREAILEAAKARDVTISRDSYGVPHVFGKTDADVAFGLGYAHSEDDFENIALSLAQGRGDYGRFAGAQGAQTDYLVKLFKIQELVEARYDSDLDPKTRALVEAYADGINLWGVEHGEGKWRGLLPVTGKDVVAGFVFRGPFFFGLQDELVKVFTPQGFDEEAAESGEVTASLLNGNDAPMGSNALALAPYRSAEGVTRLAVNSHQPYLGPVAWYEIVLQSEEGWHVAGSTFPGGPLMLHGHNENLGWAQTVNKPDLIDIYALTVNPENPNEYKVDGEWRAFERWQVPLRVQLFGPFSWVVKREALWSLYGPTLRLDHGTFAIHHAGMNEVRQVEQVYRLNKARDFKEWHEAMEMLAFPSTNYVYADREGRIAYFYNAKMPKRKPGFNWKGLVPGDTSETLWQGFYPFEAMPHYVNPPSGYLLNSNNQPFFATADQDNLRAEDYPSDFGIDEPMSNRALRGLQLFSELDMVSRDDFYRIKFDKGFHPESEMRQILAPLLAMETDDPELAGGLAVLRAWDGMTDKENPHAALSILTGLRLYEEKPQALELKTQALKTTMSKLLETHGRLDPPWEAVNRIKRGSVDMGLAGGPDILRAVYGGYELDDQGTLTAIAGDTFVMMVEWDETGKVSSESIHQFGSATLDDSSPHYADQVPLFADEAFKPVWFEKEDLLPHIERSYRPGSDEGNE